MTSPPRISLVIPSFNQATFLEATIQSVIAQDYPNLQLGIVDGGSTDGSQEIIHRYRQHFAFVISEPDNGQSQAINKGLRLADGEIMGWLCSDDLLRPGALASVAQNFSDATAADWLIGACRMVDAQGRSVETKHPSGGFTLAGMLLRPNGLVIPQPSVFWRRSLTERVGLLDESLHYAMDFDLWCRFVAAGARPRLLDVELSDYRLHPTSKSCSQQTGFLRDHIIVESRLAGNLPWRQRLQLKRRLGYQRRMLALQQLPAGTRPWRAVAARPWWLLSSQVRHALRAPTQPNPVHSEATMDQQPTAATWESIWSVADAGLAAARLQTERQSSRWEGMRSAVVEMAARRKLRCVELGSGEGDFSVLLAEMGHDVCLVDFSQKALDRAKARFDALGLRATFVQGDLFAFSNDHAGLFDVSLSLGVAEHFSGDLRHEIIAAHHRVLTPGGLTFISVPNAHCLPYRLWKVYLQARGMWRYGYEAPFSGSEMLSQAKRAGFDACTVYKTGFAASIDGCVLLPLTGKRRGWEDGPRWANAMSGWAVNMLGRAA